VSGEAIPGPTGEFLVFVLVGAVAQIVATALMLAAMRERSFAVVTALIKTEPVQVALFGLLLLGDRLTPMTAAAIVIATAGVVLMSFKPGSIDLTGGGRRPVLFGIVAGGFFALAAIGFRGAILALPSGGFLLRATTTVVWGLGLQTALLVAWLTAFNRPALIGSLREWRPSLSAGFLGALASQFWFIGFALTNAANVRTLALIEVVFAQLVSHRFLAQGTSAREIAGMALMVAGVALLLFGTSWLV
jgi:drug/metabolite transporter (DMT)-like permease